MQSKTIEVSKQSEGPSQDIRPQTLTPFWPEEAFTVKEAGFLTRKSDGTIRSWCQNNFLGRRVGGGSWLVSKVALAAFLDGDKQALNLYLRGDRTSPAVVKYYERLGISHLVKQGA
jgi:hypothetical protein